MGKPRRRQDRRDGRARRFSQFRELRLQVFQRGAEGGQAFFLLRHDLGRGARDETGVGELALGLGNFRFEPRDLLLQAFALCRLVDFDFEHQPAVADYGDGSICRGQGVNHADLR